ncbi:hypothetical protein GCM10023215_55390 [Pseudonocardia yuanmonensis]|uniref:Uncharacterized protein n=1 Tax=Pseudonocardia yuanmonensis TaxID=1095914 RepID=A0ABP8XG54_9PSEU
MTAIEQGMSRRQTWFHRTWPAAAGLAVGVASGLGIVDGAEVAPVVAASGFVYLTAAALGSRVAAWPAFGVSVVLIGVGKAVPGIDPSVWMLALAAVLAVVGLARGRLRPPWGLPLQAAAMLVLGAAALVAAQASPGWSGALVAGALLVHAGWDVHHHRTGRVVVPSMAVFCAVLDTALAALVLAVTVV